MKRFLLTALLAASSILPAAAWGPVAQKTINQLAIYGLPGSMQPYFYHIRQQLVDRALDPDKRTGTDPREAARHYINVDYYGINRFAQMPQGWEAAAGKFSADSLYAHGIGPWAVQESFDNLVIAFQTQTPDDILKYSVELANYVADLNAPLHTSDKYDPALGGLTGLWEDKLPTANMGRFKLYDGEAKPLKKDQVGPYIWLLVRESYGLVDPAVELEADASKEVGAKEKYTYTYRLGKATKQYSDKFAEVYFQKVGGMVSARLKSSAEAVATLWATAWEVAGKPNLSKLSSEELPKEEKTLLAQDLKLRKEYKLVAENRLLALVKPAAAPVLKPGQELAEPAAAPVDSTATPAPDGKAKKKKDKKKGKDEAAPPAEEANPNFSPSNN